MSESEERRQQQRFPAHHLKVLVRPLISDLDAMEGWETGIVDSLDFNRFGIALQTSHCYAIGEILSIVIQTDDNLTIEVNGMVSNRSPCELGYRLGIQFNDGIPHDETSMAEELVMLEQRAATHIH